MIKKYKRRANVEKTDRSSSDFTFGSEEPLGGMMIQ